MGAALSWVAVEGADLATILARLGLEPTGAACGFPLRGIAAHPLPDGAWLIAAGGCDHRIIQAASMATLSAGGRAVSCTVEEHVNYAACALWEGGRLAWRVEHMGDEDPEHIAYEGDPPARFHVLLADAGEATGVDPEVDHHVEIPLLLARDCVDYLHDNIDPEFDAVPFQELREIRSVSWWRRLWR
jgi:hypothetical protein